MLNDQTDIFKVHFMDVFNNLVHIFTLHAKKLDTHFKFIAIRFVPSLTSHPHAYGVDQVPQ